MLVIKAVNLQKVLITTAILSVSDTESCTIFFECHFSFKVMSFQSPRIISALQHFISRSSALWHRKLLAGNTPCEQLVFKEKGFPYVIFSFSSQSAFVLLIVQYIQEANLLSNIPVLQKCFKKN